MRETIYKMVDMLEITSTPDLLTEVIMKCPDLRCAVKRVILKTLMTSAKSYVLVPRKILLLILRIPRSKHEVKYMMDCFQQSVKKIIKAVLTTVR